MNWIAPPRSGGKVAVFLMLCMTITVMSFMAHMRRGPLAESEEDKAIFKYHNNATAPEESGQASNETKEAQDNTDYHRYFSWVPSSSSSEGVEWLVQRMSHVARGARSAPRWIFLGDSTMTRLVNLSNLKKLYPKKAGNTNLCTDHVCEYRNYGECGVHKLLLPPEKAVTKIEEHPWIPPNHSRGEGPCKFVHFCTDCQGCLAKYMFCHPSTSSHTLCHKSHLAYLPIEFAKDVEIQTAHLPTTQENLVDFLQRTWNTPELEKEYGRPICVVSAGIHDLAIPNAEEPVLHANAEYYLHHQLAAVCAHVVWLSNTSPATDDRPQTKTNIRAYNNFVLDSVRGASNEQFSFLDVFPASLDFEHRDNIHMSDRWYFMLGNMFLQVVRELEQVSADQALVDG